MEDIQNFYIDYGQLDDNKTMYIITNLQKNRGWNVYIKDNILVLDHKCFKESQPPIIKLYDNIIPNSIIYVNENPFAITFKSEKVWKHLDNKGNMKFDKKINLECFK
jgi:hypothetical protein